MNKKHYVCKGGCGNVSDYPGTCSAEGCKDEGRELLPCECDNDLHIDAGKADGDDDMEGKTETF